MNKYFCILLFFLISTLSAAITENENNLANVDYFVTDAAQIALRFDKLDLPIEKDFVILKIQADNAAENITITCINPDTGSQYHFEEQFNKYLELKIPTKCFSEDGSILIFIKSTIQFNEQNIAIAGLDSFKSEVFTGTTGILFPTADTSKQSSLNWNPFFHDEDKLSIDLNSFYSFKNNSKKTFSEDYFIADFKYKLLNETNKYPAVSSGFLLGQAAANRDLLKIKNLSGVYVVGSKNISKLVNTSIGLFHGNILNIFAFDTVTHEKFEIDNSTIIFTNFFIRVSENSGIKIETGYDFSDISEFYLVGFSRSLFNNLVSLDFGNTTTKTKDFQNDRLFASIRLKI